MDDDENVQNIIRTILTVEGFNFVTATSAQEASATIKSRRFDLIIADLVMPGQAGTVFLRELHGTEHERSPVFVLTGLDLGSDEVDVIRQEANVVEFLTKPLEIDAFVAALHKHLKTAPPRINNGPARTRAR